MSEGGCDGRGVRKEEQPEPAEEEEQQAAAPPPPAVVDEDRERERNPREEEIPDQIAEVDVPGVHVAHEDERDAEERCDEEAQDGRESTATGAHRQPASASSFSACASASRSG